MPTRSKILALILAGGQGGRLDVLTEQRAKPVVPFGGTYRLIDFALSNCVNSGLSDVWVIEQYLPHGLNDHLSNGRPWDLDRTFGGLQVLPPYEARAGGAGGGAGAASGAGFARGNADALFQHRHFVRAFGPDVLLVLSADHVVKLDLRDVVDAHFARRAEVTMVTTEVPVNEASRFGVVEVDGNDRVTNFAYKPDEPAATGAGAMARVTTEVFAYDPAVLLDTLDELDQAARRDGESEQDGGASAGLKDFGHELLPRLVERGQAFGFALAGYWRDVGTVESYWQGHQDLLAPEPAIVPDDPAWPIRTFAPPRAPARIFGTARVDDSLVSPGCVVRGAVARSVLGPGVVVEAGARVRNAVVFGGAVIEAGATVENALVDENVRVGAGARVGGPAAEQSVSNENITLVGRGAQVPAGAHLPEGSRTPPA